jgi:molybdopterin synthase sulfur carrier subunit
MIKILYFASLRERLGRGDETLAEPPASVADLRALLAGRGDAWREVFAGNMPVLVAVNQEMVDDSRSLGDGDEVGFFPPVTGG